MRKSIARLLLIVLAAATVAVAQGPHSPMPYDPKTEVTLTGSVDEVQPRGCMHSQCCASQQGGGVHLMLKSESDVIEVCVGPASFVQEKGFSFVKGDSIEVIGSRVKMAGKEVVIARQITKDKQTLTLRDSKGIPGWAGKRRRPS